MELINQLRLFRIAKENVLHEFVEAKKGERLWKDRLKYSGHELLERLLRRAQQAVPYYKQRLHRTRQQDLSQIPVISKSEIQAHYDAFFSMDFDKRSLKTITTSGTTGMPLRVARDLA